MYIAILETANTISHAMLTDRALTVVNFRLLPNTFIRTLRMPPFSHRKVQPYPSNVKGCLSRYEALLTILLCPISMTVSTWRGRGSESEVVRSALGGE